jgi:hypothetical protein
MIEIVSSSLENTSFPHHAEDLRLLAQVTRSLERVAARAVPALGGIADLLDSPGTIPDRNTLAEHARSCVVALVQRANPADMREVSLAMFEALSSENAAEVNESTDVIKSTESTGSTRPTEARRAKATDPAMRAMIQEWARIPAAAAQLRGSSAVDQVLRGFRGRAEVVLGIVAKANGVVTRQDVVGALEEQGHDLGDKSGVSHILRGLEDADLVLRWHEGRTTMIEITPEGRAAAEQRGLAGNSREEPGKQESEPEALLLIGDSVEKRTPALPGLARRMHRQNCDHFFSEEWKYRNPNSSRGLQRTGGTSRVAALSGSSR